MVGAKYSLLEASVDGRNPAQPYIHGHVLCYQDSLTLGIYEGFLPSAVTVLKPVRRTPDLSVPPLPPCICRLNALMRHCPSFERTPEAGDP